MASPAFSNVKVTLKFAYPLRGGWTESYYSAGSAINDALKAKVLRLVAARQKPLVPACYILGYRISAVQVRRVSQSFRLTGYTGTPGGTPDVPAVTTNVAISSAGGHIRQLQLHGCPDSLHNFNAAGVEGNPVSANVKAFLDELQSGEWQMRVETQTAGDPTLKTASGFVVAAGRLTIIAPGLTIAPKDRFILTGLAGYKVHQFRGTWQAESYTDPTLVTRTKRLLDPTFILEQPAEIRVVGSTFYAFENFGSSDIEGARSSSRKIGRQPDGPRGRSSAAR